MPKIQASAVRACHRLLPPQRCIWRSSNEEKKGKEEEEEQETIIVSERAEEISLPDEKRL